MRQLPKTRMPIVNDRLINVPITDDDVLQTVTSLPRTPDKDDSTERDESKMSAKMKAVLVSLMAAMFFIYVGMEVAFGTFISIFAVKSSLRFTRPEGYCLVRF